jgi:2-oxoglutarate ferredoxin oxidoreductase subunit beta
MQKLAEKYIRKEALPFIFCPGCGDGQILFAFINAIEDLQLKSEVAAVSGIGCSSWMPVYLDIDVLHTIHGRAIAVAEGLKLVQSDKKIVVFTGDGDCSGIGGNHLIHAARRNIDITVIMINNSIYGMTGGQKAPTTPLDCKTKTSPYGNEERPFDVCSLVKSAGGTFVSRSATAYPNQMTQFIKDAISHKGFSFVEILTQCPTQAGRLIYSTNDPSKMLEWQKENTVNTNDLDAFHEGKIPRGIFVRKDELEFTERLKETRRKINENNNR